MRAADLTGCRGCVAVEECGSRQRPTLLVAGYSFAPTLRRRGPYFGRGKAPGCALGYRKRPGRTPPVPSRAGANVDRTRHRGALPYACTSAARRALADPRPQLLQAAAA